MIVYSNESNSQWIGYADAGYLFDPYKGRSWTDYLFTCDGITISCHSIKQTMVVTSSNHAEFNNHS